MAVGFAKLGAFPGVAVFRGHLMFEARADGKKVATKRKRDFLRGAGVTIRDDDD